MLLSKSTLSKRCAAFVALMMPTAVRISTISTGVHAGASGRFGRLSTKSTSTGGATPTPTASATMSARRSASEPPCTLERSAHFSSCAVSFSDCECREDYGRREDVDMNMMSVDDEDDVSPPAAAVADHDADEGDFELSIPGVRVLEFGPNKRRRTTPWPFLPFRNDLTPPAPRRPPVAAEKVVGEVEPSPATSRVTGDGDRPCALSVQDIFGREDEEDLSLFFWRKFVDEKKEEKGSPLDVGMFAPDASMEDIVEGAMRLLTEFEYPLVHGRRKRRPAEEFPLRYATVKAQVYGTVRFAEPKAWETDREGFVLDQQGLEWRLRDDRTDCD